MPLVTRKHELERVTLDEDVLKDTDEVYYCEISKEIFRNYEDYFMRVMLLNSTVWTCALTSRPNLTYGEALDSEKAARRVLRKFPYELKAPLVYLASLTKRRAISELVEDVFTYSSTRFFREETVSVNQEKDHWRECEIMSIVFPVPASDDDPLACDEPVDPAVVQYKVRRIDVVSKKLQEPFVALGKNIRRPRAILNKEKLKLFMKHCVEFTDGLLSIKPSSYTKFVTDGGVSKFADFWVGSPPVFAMSKALQSKLERAELDKKKAKDKKETKSAGGKDKATKSSAKDKSKDKGKEKAKEKAGKDKLNKSSSNKQPSISNYFAKNDGKSPNEEKPPSDKAAAPAASKFSNEQLIRMRKEKEERAAAEKQKQIEEKDRINVLVANAQRSFNKIRDDLELQDQRLLPLAKPLKTLIPLEYQADAMFVMEFMYSFAELLECTDKFPKGFNLQLIQRALLCREVAGPLSDTIQVLLGTIFSLHIDETNEVNVAYVSKQHFEEMKETVDPDVRDATLATSWTHTYLSLDLVELPMDATTLSELLRIHLLTSGASVQDECAKWRYQQRGGYRNEDDPGLILRQKHPHIIRQLAEKTVYELDTVDIMRILTCLINQIVSYSTIRDAIEERLSTAYNSRVTLRSLIATERKRDAALQLKRKTLRDTLKKAIGALEGTADVKLAQQNKLSAAMDAELKALETKDENAKYEHNVQVQKLRREIFSYQLQLGTDRASRTYWLFESLPGLFIVTPGRDQVSGCIAEAPVKQYPTLARCTEANRNVMIKQIITSQEQSSDKENQMGNHDGKKSKKVLPNGVGKDAVDAMDVDESTADLPTELLMCTGSEDTCPVHGKHVDWCWSFLSTEPELDALIASLNPRGTREKVLKENLEVYRDMILEHINSASAKALNVSDSDRTAQMQLLRGMPSYSKANLGFPEDATIGVVMEGSLVDLIVTLERRVTEGHLGKLSVPDLDKWRDALTYAKDDGQSDTLCWGPNNAYNKDQRTGSQADEPDSEESTPYVDPGACMLTESAEVDADVLEMRERIFYIARSLLQVAVAIDQQFLRAPFGVQNQTFKTNPAILAKGREALLKWQVSLMNCNSYSQVYLHYSILDDAIIWSRSSQNASCRVCRRRNAEQMLLCDGCNAGRHLFCFKPKLTKVPSGQWFCENCKPPKKTEPTKKKNRRVFQIKMDSDDEMLMADEDMNVLMKLNKKDKKLDGKGGWSSDDDEEPPSEDEFEDNEDDFLPEKKPSAPSKKAPPKASKRKAATPKVVVRDESSDDEWDSDDEPEVLPEKRSRRSVKKPVVVKSDSEDEDDDELDESQEDDDDKDDDDTDFEEPQRPRRPAAKKSSTATNKSKKTAGRSSSRRASTIDEETRPTNGHRQSTGGSSRRSRRIDDDNDNLLLDTVACYELLGDMAKHDDVWPFDRPVNKVDVPDYYKVIQRPMDLAKIKSKLNLGEYRTNYDIMNDIQLIFSNCDLYNNSGSDIYSAGVTLERFVRDRCAALNLPFKTSDMLVDDASTPASSRRSSLAASRN